MSTVGTFQGLIDLLNTTVQRDDLASQYLDIANRAVRKLATMHSFEQMKATGVGTVVPGQTQVTLPVDFKEFQTGRYPIFDTPVGSAGELAPVFPRVELEKLIGAGFVNPRGYVYTQDFTGGAQTFAVDRLSIDVVAHNLKVYYFAYPPECADPANPAGGTVPLLEFYFNLVLLKAYSIAFEGVNDELYVMHETQFLKEYALETGEDVKQALQVLRRADKS